MALTGGIRQFNVESEPELVGALSEVGQQPRPLWRRSRCG